MADVAGSHPRSIEKASRTRVAVAVLVDVVPFVVALSRVLSGDGDLFLPRVVRYQLWANTQFVFVGTVALLLCAAISAFALMSPLGPRESTWGEWVTGIRAEGASASRTVVRWLGRILTGTLLVALVARPFLTEGGADLLSALLCVLGFPAIIGLIVRWLRRGRDSRGRPTRIELVDDADVFVRERSPERMVASVMIVTATLIIVRHVSYATADSSDSPIPYFVLLYSLTPLIAFCVFATIGLLLAGRARALRDGREFEMSEWALVLGFLIPPYWPIHAFRVASRVLRAFPEARHRSSAKLPPASLFVVAAACAVAAHGIRFIAIASSIVLGLRVWSLSSERLVNTAMSVVIASLMSIVLFRVREVLARRGERRRIEEVAATFE